MRKELKNLVKDFNTGYIGRGDVQDVLEAYELRYGIDYEELNNEFELLLHKSIQDNLRKVNKDNKKKINGRLTYDKRKVK
jgi:hypothetical protein